PVGVHIAVVDPGVGGDRRALAVSVGRGDFLVGPDNGLLAPAAERLGGAVDAFQLLNREYQLDPVSPTFHGRDIFAPAAAHLSAGLSPERLGPAVPVGELRRPWEPVRATPRGLEVEVIDIDRFGTVRTSAVHEDLKKIDVGLGESARLILGSGAVDALVCRTFAEQPPGRPMIILDSSGVVAIAANRASAGDEVGLKSGEKFTIAASKDGGPTESKGSA
ncbi:MAG: S-adenosyl-l-methionine hydroxide adenosyltransferase family protein, partial [Terriglobia bacterium]